MRWLVVCLSLFLCACAPVSADPIEVTRIVEVTRVVEVTRLVEVMVTPTPLPTVAVATPEPIILIPTATPQLLPDGWGQYALLNGEAIIAYPLGWPITDEALTTVSFDPSMGSYDTLYVSKASSATFDMTASTTEELIRFIKILYISTSDQDSVTFHREGSLETGKLNAYFTATRYNYIYENTGAVLMVAVVEGDHTAILHYYDAGSQTIPDSTFDMVQQMAQHIQYITTLEFD